MVVGEVVAAFVIASTVVVVETSAVVVGPAIVPACAISDVVLRPVVVASPVVAAGVVAAATPAALKIDPEASSVVVVFTVDFTPVVAGPNLAMGFTEVVVTSPVVVKA